jgi:hypothetical protein
LGAAFQHVLLGGGKEVANRAAVFAGGKRQAGELGGSGRASTSFMSSPSRAAWRIASASHTSQARVWRIGAALAAGSPWPGSSSLKPGSRVSASRRSRAASQWATLAWGVVGARPWKTRSPAITTPLASSTTTRSAPVWPSKASRRRRRPAISSGPAARVRVGCCSSVPFIQSPLMRNRFSAKASPSAAIAWRVSASAPMGTPAKAWLPRKWSGWWWVLITSATGLSVTAAMAARICCP